MVKRLASHVHKKELKEPPPAVTQSGSRNVQAYCDRVMYSYYTVIVMAAWMMLRCIAGQVTIFHKFRTFLCLHNTLLFMSGKDFPHKKILDYLLPLKGSRFSCSLSKACNVSILAIQYHHFQSFFYSVVSTFIRIPTFGYWLQNLL